MQLVTVDGGSLGANHQRRVKVFAELDKDQVTFPTGWAVFGDVLRAHKSGRLGGLDPKRSVKEANGGMMGVLMMAVVMRGDGELSRTRRCLELRSLERSSSNIGCVMSLPCTCLSC